MPVQQRGLRSARAATLLAVSVCAAAVVGMAAPAGAEPTDSGTAPANSPDASFVQSLDKIGIPYPGQSEAVSSAVTACTQIAEGHTIKDAVNGVRDANPALTLLQGAHFVAIARAIYCPGHRETA